MSSLNLALFCVFLSFDGLVLAFFLFWWVDFSDLEVDFDVGVSLWLSRRRSASFSSVQVSVCMSLAFLMVVDVLLQMHSILS